MSLRHMPADDTLPVTILGGYLGAGNTTLVNRLLRAANGRRIAVLVNDFGDIGIDADLIEAREGDVINLAGGCVCCSFGSDLMAALLRLRERSSLLDHVLIETSGVALPATVASTVSLVEGLRVDAIVLLADASVIRQQASDRYVGETVLRQLQQADLLVLNKLDLVQAAEKRAVINWMAQSAAGVCLVEAEYGQLPPELLFDDMPFVKIGVSARQTREEDRPLRVGSLRTAFSGASASAFPVPWMLRVWGMRWPRTQTGSCGPKVWCEIKAAPRCNCSFLAGALSPRHGTSERLLLAAWCASGQPRHGTNACCRNWSAHFLHRKTTNHQRPAMASSCWCAALAKLHFLSCPNGT